MPVSLLSTRTYISMGLVSIVSSALLAASFLGMIPDREGAVREGRVALAESVAASSTAILTSNDPRRLETVLRFLMKRNPDIESIGVRKLDGTVVMATAGHEQAWTAMESVHVAGAQIQVPVWAGSERWGQVEFRFKPTEASGLAGLLALPWLRLLLVCGVLCFVGFHLYLGRVLKSLDPSSAIPGRVRAALDTITEGLLVVDRQRNVVLVNQALAGLLGTTQEKLMGSPAAALDWRDAQGQPMPKADLPWNRALEDGEVQRDGRILLTDATGRQCTFVVNCSPVLGSRGKPGGALISFEDITQLEANKVELKTARDEAQAANRAKSEFLANMSHEIRTPMNAILGFTELLRRGYGKGERDSAKHLATIHNSGKHLLALINDILDLSKVEAGRMEVERIDCAPHLIVRQAVQELSANAREKGITLDWEAQGLLPSKVSSDPGRLRQIVLNLLSNAIKFTNAGGVTVLLAYDDTVAGAFYRIQVKDTGIGVPEAKIDTMFEPFTQADASITRRFGGTGLGLTISRNFARALGGDIVATSVLGQGSTFTLSFDAGRPADAVMLAPQQVKADQADGPEHAAEKWEIPSSRVLVVDDGPENRELVSLVLAEHGLWVEEAENGKVAVDKVQETAFDLILMDMQMPVMDGYEATRTLRARGVITPIVALTANAMKGYEAQVLEAGCTAYLTKPIDIDVLLAQVAALLGGTRAKAGAAAGAVTIPALDTAGTHASQEPILSKLADKPRLVPIILKFVQRLTEMVQDGRRASETGDLEEVARIAHWLAGSAGTVGYGAFTAPARNLERLAKAGDRAGVVESMALIEDMATRVVAPVLEEPAPAK